MTTIGDDLTVMAGKISTLSTEDVKKRLRYMAEADLALFADTRDASQEEYNAIERRQERGRKITKLLRDRLKELQDAAEAIPA
jgi:hypothetical protein